MHPLKRTVWEERRVCSYLIYAELGLELEVKDAGPGADWLPLPSLPLAVHRTVVCVF